MSRRKQIHDGRGIGRTDAEVDDRQSITVGTGLHRSAFSTDRHFKTFGEFHDIIIKIGEQDVITEFPDFRTGVTWKPVPGDVFF